MATFAIAPQGQDTKTETKKEQKKQAKKDKKAANEEEKK
jgi:hypothetical protein